jgi:hypothetical protein
MQTVTLSESAISLLKLRARFYPVDNACTALDACHELAESGLMALDETLAVGPRFRLTDEGWRRANSLSAAEFLPGISDQAWNLLQSHLAAIGLKNGKASGYPTTETREAYRELSRAGMMDACHTLAGGPESLYRITEEAYKRRDELLAIQR